MGKAISSKNLLIAIPTKSTQLYLDRMVAAEGTWLKDSPCDWKAFRDADLSIKPDDARVRPLRTQRMCEYALRNGYDFIFRTDSDAYVWINRLLSCGFEHHDYMGWCLDYPKHLETDHGLRTAHGGIGFFLSRKAMEVVVNSDPWPQGDGIYWGDIWTGEVLWANGIYCHRDTRFLDGSGTSQHHGNIFAEELPLDHPYVSIHPVPAENMYPIYERFKHLSQETVAPERQMWHRELKIDYGRRQPVICNCSYCLSGSD